MPRSDQHSGGWGGSYARAETWAEFDALPLLIRRLYWVAPYKLTASPAVDDLARGLPPAFVASELAKSMRRSIGRETLRIYGAEHPQAARP